MKFVYFAGLGFLGTCNAGIAEMLEVLEQAKRHFNQPGLRTDLVASMNSFGAQLVNYGCWCSFDDDHSLVGGDTQDHFDEQCKLLHQGYDCLIADLGASCSTPWSESFGVPDLFSGDMSDPTTSLALCTARNAGDDCKIKSCQVEMGFIYYVIQSIFQQPGANPAPPNPSLSHGTFDNSAMCIKASTVGDGLGFGGNGGTGNPSVSCCGPYPQKIPYNAILNTCSADGNTLTPIGN